MASPDWRKKFPLEWVDSTSYSRGDDRKPSAWRLRLTPDVAITVVKAHIHYPKEWVMHCHPWFDTSPLNLRNSVSDKIAKAKALELVLAKAEELADALEEAKKLLDK